MTIIKLIYKVLHKINHTISLKYSRYATLFHFIGQSVIYKDFFTTGVPFVRIQNKTAQMQIDEGFRMNNGMHGNQIGFNTPCTFIAEYGEIKIGKNVGMSQTSLVAKHGNITIGNNCKFGGGVRIYTTDFHSLNYLERRQHELDMDKAAHGDVVIGNDCFIGAGSVILKGVTIGDKVIIGANSVVTKDVKNNCVVAGAPAKVVREI